MAGAQRVDITVAVVLERLGVGVEALAVEFDDDPFLREQRVDLVAGDSGVDYWAGESVALAEGQEGVLEFGLRRAVDGRLGEGCDEGGAGVRGAAGADVGQGGAGEVMAEQSVVDGPREAALLGQTGRAVQGGAGRAGGADAELDPGVAREEAGAAVDGDACRPRVALESDCHSRTKRKRCSKRK